MADEQRINVFLIFRDMTLCKTLADALMESGYNVFQYPTAREFLSDKVNYESGIVLCDIRLPGMFGTELAEQLRAEGGTFPVTLISARQDVSSAIRSGVDFVCGPATVKSLSAAIDRAANGESFDEKKLRWGFDNLTNTEAIVLKGMVDGKASRTIALELGLSTKTVEAHRLSISHKTRSEDVADLVRKWRVWQKLM